MSGLTEYLEALFELLSSQTVPHSFCKLHITVTLCSSLRLTTWAETGSPSPRLPSTRDGF